MTYLYFPKHLGYVNGHAIIIYSILSNTDGLKNFKYMEIWMSLCQRYAGIITIDLNYAIMLHADMRDMITSMSG